MEITTRIYNDICYVRMNALVWFVVRGQDLEQARVGEEAEQLRVFRFRDKEHSGLADVRFPHGGVRGFR